LVLTSSLGSGHLAAARAIAQGVLARLPDALVQTLDFWSLMDRRVARIVRAAYLQLVQVEGELYDRVYSLDQHVWRRTLYEGQPPPAPIVELAARLLVFVNEAWREPAPTGDGQRRLVDRVLFRQACTSLASYARGNTSQALIGLALARWCWLRLARRLEARLLALQPDVVVSTMMWTAALCSRAKLRRHLAVPIVGVPTDYGIHDFWVQRGIDCYCVAHDAIANLPRLRAFDVRVTGIPLMPGFARPPSMPEAREAIGLRQDRPVLLVNGGGIGVGVEDTAVRLLDATRDVQIVALTGHDEAACASLGRTAAEHRDRLHVHGWTDHPEVFLRAADLVVGKLGGLTVAEALACGRPILATRSLRGQEGFNQRFVEAHGVGSLVAGDELVTACRALLADPNRLVQLQHQAERLGRRDGAARIAALVDQLTARGAVRPAATEPG
jgi:processive 1,2-diacylglycerol beta-glucosyltransferase